MTERRASFLRFSLLVILGLWSISSPCPTEAQSLTRPHVPWRTVQTAHFSFHFPAEMTEWTMFVAARIESAAQAVEALVTNRPAARVTVVVEDPANVANGFALPFLEGPVIVLWPTPPTPEPTLGAHRGWGEVLALHEYGHIAHLTFPSRNPGQQWLWRFAPTRMGPISLAPMWVIEGYATVLEGKLTGSGRPHSVSRAAILRQWALEGRLPTYGQLDASGSFFGGSMRYLVGSAFLEWLEDRRGDSSLVHVWRRMTARIPRGFSEAFIGVYGAPPADLYGRFAVDVTAKALEVERRLKDASLAEGQLVQKLNWATGEPAVSPDGELVAVVLRSQASPPRLVIWRTATPSPDSAELRRRERARRLDPLDVPAIDSFPRPRIPVATLPAVAGRSHELPRWFPDGSRLLVSRDEPAGDGTTRPDLFVWNYRTGALRRLTRGAAIRSADPSPDGRTAAAVQCANGICNLVLVDLPSGTIRTLAAGSLTEVWHRPRWSPDGRSVAASLQMDGRWHVVLVDPQTGQRNLLVPAAADSASRYAPSWSADGRSLVMVSEADGIANLERIDVDSRTVTSLTRVTGGAYSPDVSRPDRVVYYLTLHAKGYDLRRRSLDSMAVPRTVVLSDSLSPAVPPLGFGAPSLRAESLAAPRAYGLGPRRWRILPGVLSGADGPLGTLMVANMDPIGRLSIVGQGGFGRRGTWRGGAITMAVRALPATLSPAFWYVDRQPAPRNDVTRIPTAHEATYRGGGVTADYSRAFGLSSYGLRGGFSRGALDAYLFQDAPRSLVFGEVRGSLNFSSGSRTLAVAGSALGSAGETDDKRWTRVMVSARLTAGPRSLPLRGRLTYGAVSATDPVQLGSAFEEFVVGGSELPYFDPVYLSQFVPMPGVPLGFLRGRRLGAAHVALGGLTFEPFFDVMSAGDRLDDWKRIAGVERAFGLGPLGFARLPLVRARAGASYSFDEPFRKKVRGWASLIYSP